MRNLLFFLWMLLFPLIDDVSLYIRSKAGKKSSDHESDGETALAFFIFYIVVAYILHESAPN